jgi:hypothetical protein
VAACSGCCAASPRGAAASGPRTTNLSVRCWADDFGSTADLEIAVLDAAGTDVTPPDQGFEATSSGYLTYNISTAPGDYDVLIRAEDDLGSPAAYYRCAVYLTDFEVEVGTAP